MTEMATGTHRGGGRFHLTRRIGEGGFGIVYEAFDTRRNSVVALKTLRRFDVAALSRFKHEFRTLADVDHPNLVSLYELFSEGDEWFFTMELVQGVHFMDFIFGRPQAVPSVQPYIESRALDVGLSELEQNRLAPQVWSRIDAQRQPDLDALRDGLLQVAHALYVIHQMGILHCDVKPSNVLVTADKRAVLMDFGLATELRPTHDSIYAGAFGTPAYMSPEYGAGMPISEASDWYALGAVLYEALTGVTPFVGTPLEILSKKQFRDAPLPSSIAGGIPADLDQLCRQLLQRDPAARPSGAEVVRQLREGLGTIRPIHATPPRMILSHLLGRDRHLALLAEAFRATGGGHPVVVCIHGPSGIGKTALVERYLRQVRQSEPAAVVLAGRCYEQESVPYKAIDGVIDYLARHLMSLSELDMARLLPREIGALCRLFPALRQLSLVATVPSRSSEAADSHELRRRALAALRDLLGALADQRPLVLFIDDLQWSDLDSIALLVELLRPPDAPSLLLIVSCRTEDRHASPVGRLFSLLTVQNAKVDWREVEVGELTLAEARSLAGDLLGPVSKVDAYSEAIAQQCEGNPFFAQELVQYVLDGGEVVRLEQVLQARLAQSPDDASELLELVSLNGQPLDVTVASHALAASADLQMTVHYLRARRLIRTGGTSGAPTLETYHDRIREAVISRLSEARLKALHRRLATTLTALGSSDDETVGFHYEGAGELESAGRHYRVAGDRAAAVVAFNSAVALYHRALQLQYLVGSERYQLKVKLAEAYANAGRGVEAAKAYDDAAQELPEADALELRRHAAYHYAASGYVDEGNEAFRKVLAHVNMRLPQSPAAKLAGLLAVRARLRLRGLSFHERDESRVAVSLLHRIDVAWSVGTGLGLIDLSTGWQFTSRALLHALQAGEPARVARALAWEAATSASMSLAGQRRARTLLDRCGSLTASLDRPYPRAMFALATGLVEYSAGHWTLARRLLADAEEIFSNECAGTSWELSTLRAFLLRNLLIVGDFTELRTRAIKALQRAEQTGDLYYATYHGVFIEPHLRLFADHPEEARRSIRSALARWSSRAYHVQHALAAEAVPTIELYVGNPAAAVQSLREQWPLMKRHFILRNLVYRRGVLQLRARAAIGAAMAARGADRESHLRAVDADRRSLEQMGQPCLHPFITLIEAGAAHARGNIGDARNLLTRAADELADAGLRGFSAATRRTLGTVCEGAQGRDLIREAEEWMHAQHIVNPARFTAMLVPGFHEAGVTNLTRGD